MPTILMFAIALQALYERSQDWSTAIFHKLFNVITTKHYLSQKAWSLPLSTLYESESISNQPIPFPMDRDGHDFHALFQYMFYTWVQNCTRIESFFNKILNVKHG